MTFDVLATAAIADELRKHILPGRVQKALLPGELSIGLEVYAYGARRYLYATARNEEARVQLTEERLRRGPDTPSPLLLLLRKYAVGGRIVEITQPAFERILRLTVEGVHGLVHLYFEIMGRYSNIILVDAEGTILDSAKRVPPSLSRRVVLPQHRYEPPPPQAKAHWVSLTPGRLAKLVAEALPEDSSLWRKLVACVAGVSPLLAREIVYRAVGDAQATKADSAAILKELSALMGLIETGEWQPCVAREGDRLVAFAPYLLMQYPHRETVSTFSEAMARYFGQDRQTGGYAEAKEELRALISAAQERLRRQQEGIRRSLEAAEAGDELRQKGELILAYGGQINPGQEELSVESASGELIHIDLDPTLSPSENAQRYFREYRKAKAALEGAPQRLQEVALKLAYLEQLDTDLMLAASRPEIDQVRVSLAEAGYLKTKAPPRRAAQNLPSECLSDDGFLILVGKNSHQNDALTFQRAKPHDIWLHARGIPGSHVLIVTHGEPVPEKTLRQAAELAAYYSRGRNDRRVEVDYTQRRYVRRIPGGGPGMVTYRGQKTLPVKPRDWLGSKANASDGSF